MKSWLAGKSLPAYQAAPLRAPIPAAPASAVVAALLKVLPPRKGPA